MMYTQMNTELRIKQDPYPTQSESVYNWDTCTAILRLGHWSSKAKAPFSIIIVIIIIIIKPSPMC